MTNYHTTDVKLTFDLHLIDLYFITIMSSFWSYVEYTTGNGRKIQKQGHSVQQTRLLTYNLNYFRKEDSIRHVLL